MKDMVEIEVVLDEKYPDPKVTIQTKAATTQVENIIHAIETASDSDFPQIAAYDEERLIFVSQRDIVRAHTEGRRIVLETAEASYTVRKTLTGLEEVLNADRFLRISQSEIINLYKVRCFDFDAAGTIGVEFDCGTKTWAARRCVGKLKEMLMERSS